MRDFDVTSEHKVFFDLIRGQSPSSLKNLNTNKLFALFQRHRLLSLSSGILNLLDKEDEIIWKQAIQKRALATLHLTSELLTVLGILEEKGIDIIPLKGPVLAVKLYGESAKRQVRDLDLLVVNSNIFEALKVLEGLGYVVFTPSKVLTSKQWNYYFKHKYDVGLKNLKKGSVIEIHAGIIYPKLINTSASFFAENPISIKISEVEIPCLNEENNFLYLALHGAHHLYFRLFWLRDVAEAIQNWDLNHENILANAARLGVERMLGVSLLLVDKYFGVSVPESYSQYIKKDKKALQKLCRMCSNAILDNDVPNLRSRLRSTFYYLHLKKGLRNNWNALAGLYHRWYIRRFFGGV